MDIMETRRYDPGLLLAIRLFLAFGQKKSLLCCFGVFFWFPVVTLVTFSSSFVGKPYKTKKSKNISKNSEIQKLEKIFKKIQKNPNKSKVSIKIQKNPKIIKNGQKIQKSGINLKKSQITFFQKKYESF